MFTMTRINPASRRATEAIVGLVVAVTLAETDLTALQAVVESVQIDPAP